MELPVRNAAGDALDPIEVDAAVFGIAPNEAVVHQTLVAQLAARRGGHHSTKSRGEVRGSTAKIRRQKGLGMARMGSNRSPIRRGGGVAFGPKPRSYTQRLPKRMRRLALRSVLSARVRDERLHVVDDIAFEAPSTRAARDAGGAVESGADSLMGRRSCRSPSGGRGRTLHGRPGDERGDQEAVAVQAQDLAVCQAGRDLLGRAGVERRAGQRGKQ